MFTPMAQQPNNDHRHTSLVVLPNTTFSLDTLHKISAIEASVIAAIDTQTDEEIIQTRLNSKYVERFGWKVQCKCDYVIKSRAEKLKGGRGINDSENRGVNAALRKQAKKINVTPNTIRTNARIYELILSVEQSGNTVLASLDILDEKGYYLAALDANNPQEAVALFAKEKASPQRFRVSDAKRFLQRLGLTKKVITEKAVTAIRTFSRTEQYAYLVRVKELLAESQGTDTFNRLFGECYFDVVDEIGEMFDDDVLTAIKANYNKDCQTAIALSASTKFPVDVIIRVLKKNEDDFMPIRNSDRWEKIEEE